MAQPTTLPSPNRSTWHVHAQVTLALVVPGRAGFRFTEADAVPDHKTWPRAPHHQVTRLRSGPVSSLAHGAVMPRPPAIPSTTAAVVAGTSQADPARLRTIKGATGSTVNVVAAVTLARIACVVELITATATPIAYDPGTRLARGGMGVCAHTHRRGSAICSGHAPGMYRARPYVLLGKVTETVLPLTAAAMAATAVGVHAGFTPTIVQENCRAVAVVAP